MTEDQDLEQREKNQLTGIPSTPGFSKILHVVEAGSHAQSIFLPDETFSLALDALVIACVDIVFCWRGQVLLAKRNHLPRQDWWVIGGRMKPSEDPLQTAQRKVQEEAGLKISSDRPRFIAVYSTQFAQRSQPPQSYGLHSLNLTYAIALNDAEQATLDLTPKEYDTGIWITPDRLSTVLGNDVLDHYLLRVVNDLQARYPDLLPTVEQISASE